MQIALLELLTEVKEYLFAPREIVINTNIATVLLTAACIIYLLFSYFRVLTKSMNKQNCGKKQHHYSQNSRYKECGEDAYGPYNKPDPAPKWYPAGWYWDEIDCCWKPPDYPKK